MYIFTDDLKEIAGNAAKQASREMTINF